MKGWVSRLRVRLEDALESRGRLSPYRRLVVVCGMARTGTSALAAYVGSHPDVKPVVGGPLWHRMESDYVRTNVDWSFIDGVLKEFRDFRVLIKQPWLENNVDFFDRAVGAKVMVCTREPDALLASWQQSQFSGGARARPLETYSYGMFSCLRLMMRGAMEVKQEKMGPGIAGSVGKFLGLSPDGFDASVIASKWTGAKNRDWMEAKAIWRDKR